MPIISPDNPWDSCNNKPIKEAIRASFRNTEQLFDLLNQKNPPVVPNLLQGAGSDEFSFMISEL
jgi:hypothetical protein